VVEKRISSELRAILRDLPIGADIPDTEPFRQILSGLEYYLPGVLAEIHREWRRESLDGVIPLTARKTGELEVEIFGVCILISDQTLAPIHIHLQVAPAADEIAWMVLRVGETGEEGMTRTRYRSLAHINDQLCAAADSPNAISWHYQVCFGKRRPKTT
jgi:hypothetical protein